MENPVNAAKGTLTKFKGLPPWAYVAAVGVGGIAVWYGINRSKSNAELAAADTTGDYSGTLSATTAGDAYPSGSQGALSYYDPTTGVTEPPVSTGTDWEHITELLGTLGVTGGGTQSSASANDHYTPPTIVVNIPDSAPPVQTAPAVPATGGNSPATKKADPCVGEFPFLQDVGTRKGMCYKVVQKGGKNYRYYKNGDKVAI